MKKTNVFALALVPMLFMSCSKDDSNNAAVNDGYCTNATVNAYNQISESARLFRIYKTESSIVDTHNSCTNYKSLIAGNSCKLSLGGTETTVNSSSQDGICNPVATAMTEINQTRQPSRPPRNNPGGLRPADVIAAEDHEMILALSGEINVKIVDATNFSDLEFEAFYFQNGKALKLTDPALDQTRVMCTFMSTVQPLIAGKSKLYFDTFKLSDYEKSITLTSSKEIGIGTFSQITCWNGEKITNLTLGDLKQAFKDVLEFGLTTPDKD